MNRIVKTAALIVATASLVGCASGPSVSSVASPSADFSYYRTYGFHPDVDQTGNLGERTVYAEIIKGQIGQEMQARGYRFSSAPDLLINFRLFGEERIETRSTPQMSMGYSRGPYGYSGYGWGVGYSTTSQEVRQYTQGTLVIDFVDPRQNAQVWTGQAVDRVTEDGLRNPEAPLREAVRLIMDQYRIGAGGETYTPPVPEG